MANEQDNVGRLRAAYRSWHESKGANVRAWLDLIADDACFRSLAGGAAGMEFTRARCGRNEIASYFEEMTAEWEMISFTPEDFIAQADRVAAVGSCAWRSRKTGKVAESAMAHFFTFRDGKVVDVLELFDTAAAIAAHSA